MRTEEGTREIRSLFGETYFNHPKPVALIKRCILIGSNQDDIVLDFFSGSATTAQSVFEVNAENIDEQRRWIMVQLPEATPPNSEARNAGYNTIDQIGQERIRRAAAKIKAETVPISITDLSIIRLPNPTATRSTNWKILTRMLCLPMKPCWKNSANPPFSKLGW